MTYQHAILPTGAVLEVRVEPELRGRWAVLYRVTASGVRHRDQWIEVPHCSVEEALDVVLAVTEGFSADYDAQGLF